MKHFRAFEKDAAPGVVVQVAARVVRLLRLASDVTGVVLALHSDAPEGPVKEALRLLDEEPVLDTKLLTLGRWIAQYYCAPLGEVLRSMTPLSGEVRKTRLYSLTDTGRDTARQLLLRADEEDPALGILRLLEARPLSASYLQKKLPRRPVAPKADCWRKSAASTTK